MTSVVLITLALVLQVPPPATPTPLATPAPRPAAQGTTAAPTGKPGALSLTVTNEKGEVVAGAVVTAHGAVDRGGVTASDGLVTLQNMPPGAYRCRIARDGFVLLDKEVTIRAGARTTTEAVLSAAPAPPAPAPPPETRPAVPAAGAVGTPRVLSIADLAEQMLKESPPTVERLVGCSGLAASRVITTKENIALHRHAETDEMLYVVAGEALLTIAEKEQVIAAGWFGLVPRGVSHSLTRRGRGPLVVLSVQTGQPCGAEK
jgi:uncharacterized RmlC-like cupin family protein